VNDLSHLEPDHAYWIYATETVTLYMEGVPPTQATAVATLPAPPATFYGVVRANDSFTPTAGMMVEAYVEQTLCGQGETKEQNGEVVYSVDVQSASVVSGCGEAGRIVTFRVAGQLMTSSVAWLDAGVYPLALAADPTRYHLFIAIVAGASAGTEEPLFVPKPVYLPVVIQEGRP
jgi:hypothetical protein